MSSGAGEVGGTQTGSGVSSRSDCDRLVGRRLWLVFPGACVAAIAVGPCGGSTTEPPAAEPTATFPPSAVVPRRKCLAMASAENYFFNWSIHATCGGTVRRGIARVEGSRRDRQSGLNNASRFRVRIGPRPEELHETAVNGVPPGGCCAGCRIAVRPTRTRSQSTLCSPCRDTRPSPFCITEHLPLRPLSPAFSGKRFFVQANTWAHSHRSW